MNSLYISLRGHKRQISLKCCNIYFWVSLEVTWGRTFRWQCSESLKHVPCHLDEVKIVLVDCAGFRAWGRARWRRREQISIPLVSWEKHLLMTDWWRCAESVKLCAWSWKCGWLGGQPEEPLKTILGRWWGSLLEPNHLLRAVYSFIN